MAATKMYAWSDLIAGGKSEDRKTADGRLRTVVLERNVVRRGEAVTAKDVGASEEEWNHLIESGSVRPYPLPEGADDNTSPTTAVLRKLTSRDSGEIDQNMLLELALAHPPAMNPPAEDEAERPEGA